MSLDHCATDERCHAPRDCRCTCEGCHFARSAQDLPHRIDDALAAAEQNAWLALARYKFWMFGYYAGRWVFLASLHWRKLANPFRPLVELARRRAYCRQCGSPSHPGRVCP